MEQASSQNAPSHRTSVIIKAIKMARNIHPPQQPPRKAHRSDVGLAELESGVAGDNSSSVSSPGRLKPGED